MQVTAQHGDESEPRDFQQNLGSFALQLPPGTGGSLTITVQGQTAQHCTVRVGRQEVQLVPSGFSSTTVVMAPAPLSVSGLSPKRGPSTGGPEMTITGQGFVPGRSVIRFDGIATETVPTTQTSSCQLTAFLPPDPGASRTVSVTVSNPDNQKASSADRFSYYLGHLVFERLPFITSPTGDHPWSVAMGDVMGMGTRTSPSPIKAPTR